MGFFNPLDVITGGASALPGTGVGKAAINAGKVGGGVGQGSLAALGSGVGRNAPIYNPVQPPRQLDTPNPNDQYAGIDWDRHLVGSRPGEPGFDPNKGFNQILYPGGQLPPGWQPNTGGMNPNQPPFDPNVVINGGWGSEGPGGFTGHAQDPNFGQFGQVGGGPYTNRGSGQPLNQPMGSLQSLGGGPIAATVGNALNGVGSQPNMGGPIGATVGNALVNLRGPDGSMKAVPQSDLAHWLSKGATMVSGVGNAVRGMF